MSFKVIAISLLLFILRNKVGCEVMEPVDRGLKYIESLYNELEEKVDKYYNNLKQRIAGASLSVAETIDSKVSYAAAKIQAIQEDCRLPAQLSLDNLNQKMKKEFIDCTTTKIQHRTAEFDQKSTDLVQNLKDSANTSLTAIQSCLYQEYEAVRGFKFDIIGSCEFPTGFWVSERFIEDSASVQKYGIEILKFGYDSTGIVTKCFKEELLDSSVDSIISAADKCQKRVRSKL